MVNYYNSYGIKPRGLINYILKKPPNDFVLEDKNLSENLREAVELNIKKLWISKALSNIEAKFCILD